MLVIWSLCLLHYLCIYSQETLPLLGALGATHGFRDLPWNSLSELINALSIN